MNSTTSNTIRFPRVPSPERAARRAASAAEAAHDVELVTRFNNGDETAFVEIMDRYREKTFAIARALLHNHADAEEITQDTFIRAHRGLAKFRGDSSLATWLHRIAVNLARNRYWYFVRRHKYTTLSLDFPLNEDSAVTLGDLVAGEESDPARTAAAEEFSGLVDACLEKLPPRQREILALRNTLHRSYGEIASTLGITVGTVKSRIARARENIRTQLAGMCPEFSAQSDMGSWFEAQRESGRLTQAVA